MLPYPYVSFGHRVNKHHPIGTFLEYEPEVCIIAVLAFFIFGFFLVIVVFVIFRSESSSRSRKIGSVTKQKVSNLQDLARMSYIRYLPTII